MSITASESMLRSLVITVAPGDRPTVDTEGIEATADVRPDIVAGDGGHIAHGIFRELIDLELMVGAHLAAPEGYVSAIGQKLAESGH